MIIEINRKQHGDLNKKRNECGLKRHNDDK